MTAVRIGTNAMTDSIVLYDMTEFLRNPVRTGIQRVCCEILSNWRGPLRLLPVRLDDQGLLLVLPENIVQVIIDFFHCSAQDMKAQIRQLRELAACPTARLTQDDCLKYRAILNAELFHDPHRVAYYESLLKKLPEQVFLILYDFLPQLNPQWFPQGCSLSTMDYVRMTRSLKNASFISESTRSDYLQRIVRDPSRAVGPVIPLGADGLGGQPLLRERASNRFTILGTMEPRKNHGEAFKAFESLWRRGVDVQLTIAGRLTLLEPEQRRQLETLNRHESRFEWLAEPSDAQVIDLLRHTRATIYPSRSEGFGLPPLESLALGVPVIVTEDIPSVAMIPDHGQCRLAVPDAASIATAVEQFLDDDYHRRKCDEIRLLKLPTWRDVACRVAEWVSAAA